MAQHGEHDDLGALDFYAYEPDAESIPVPDALDFSVPDEGGEGSEVEALGEYAPAEHDDTETELAAIDHIAADDEEDQDDEERLDLFTVTNPSDTVSVSALMDGRTFRVDLSPKATSMSESELAGEILVLADLARQKGLAGQHTFLLDNELLSEWKHEIGVDDEFLRDFVEQAGGLPTPDQAEAARTDVFATRYTRDHD